MEGAHANPGITTAYLCSLGVEKNYQSVSRRAFADAFEQVLNRSIATFPDVDPNQLWLNRASVIASIMFMVLFPGYFSLSGKAQQRTSEGHRVLAKHFTRELLHSRLK